MSNNTTLEEFVEELNHRLLAGYPCIVTIYNQTPAAWQASIVAAATKFFYQNPDGSPQGEPYTDYESNINIVSGQSVSLRSDFPDRCVKRADTVIYVKVPGKDPVPYAGSEEVAAGQCLTSKNYYLRPTKMVAYDQLKSGDALFELTTE